MNDILLLAVLQSLDAGDVDTARGLADLAGDDAAIETLLGDDVAESVQGPKGPPPFPGAVFDTGRHRWVKPVDASQNNAPGKSGPPPQITRPPETDEEASALAWAARDSIIGPDESDVALDGDCVRAGLVMQRLHPEAEIWTGTYDGDVDAGEGGHHVIVKIGDYFIDVTADQFGGEPVVFFTEDDLMSGKNGAAPYQYGGFQRSRSMEKQAEQMEMETGGIMAQLEEYDHGSGMLPGAAR